eukprot:jgi/Botrbrau1/20511/Bobra.145_2s0064.1
MHVYSVLLQDICGGFGIEATSLAFPPNCFSSPANDLNAFPLAQRLWVKEVSSLRILG